MKNYNKIKLIVMSILIFILLIIGFVFKNNRSFNQIMTDNNITVLCLSNQAHNTYNNIFIYDNNLSLSNKYMITHIAEQKQLLSHILFIKNTNNFIYFVRKYQHFYPEIFSSINPFYSMLNPVSMDKGKIQNIYEVLLNISGHIIKNGHEYTYYNLNLTNSLDNIYDQFEARKQAHEEKIKRDLEKTREEERKRAEKNQLKTYHENYWKNFFKYSGKYWFELEDIIAQHGFIKIDSAFNTAPDGEKVVYFSQV